MSDSSTGNDTTKRTRRDRDDIRERLIEAAVAEFAAKGFEAASTRAIAARIDAHQPQINYHFKSKLELWRAAMNHLFAQLDEAMAGLAPYDSNRDQFADLIRRFVRFSAEHPELHQILLQEETAPTDRAAWLTDTHVRPLYEAVRQLWSELRAEGVAAPVADEMIHYVLAGAASLPSANASEARLLWGYEPTDPDRVEAHADSLVALLLPDQGD